MKAKPRMFRPIKVDSRFEIYPSLQQHRGVGKLRHLMEDYGWSEKEAIEYQEYQRSVDGLYYIRMVVIDRGMNTRKTIVSPNFIGGYTEAKRTYKLSRQMAALAIDAKRYQEDNTVKDNQVTVTGDQRL